VILLPIIKIGFGQISSLITDEWWVSLDEIRGPLILWPQTFHDV